MRTHLFVERPVKNTAHHLVWFRLAGALSPQRLKCVVTIKLSFCVVSDAYRREQQQLADVLWVFAGVVRNHMTAKTVTHEEEVCEGSSAAPLLEMIYKVVDALLRCERVLVEIKRPVARTHSKHINQVDGEVFCEPRDYLEVHAASTAEAMYKYQVWLPGPLLCIVLTLLYRLANAHANHTVGHAIVVTHLHSDEVDVLLRQA